MITEASIYIRITLNSYQIAVAMLAIWDFSEKETAEIIGRDENFVTDVRRQLRRKFDKTDTAVMALHALQDGFKTDGTLNDQDIFSNEQKRKILLINDGIVFRYPPKKGK